MAMALKKMAVVRGNEHDLAAAENGAGKKGRDQSGSAPPAKTIG